MMVSANRFRSIGWIALLLVCGALVMVLAFRVNSLRSQVHRTELQIVALRKEKLYLVCDSAAFADRCLASAHAQALTLTHGAKIAKALDKMTCVILVRKIADAARVANLVAPEHLELMVAKREEAKLSAAITTAGALLLGHETPTVLGDFTAGPSHTLPTGGTGRFFSGLRVADFLRRTSFVRYDRRSLAKAAGVVAAFAGMESLDAHGRSLQVRLAKKR